MATLRYILSSKGERPAIIARLRINDQKKIQVKIPGLLGFRSFWSDAKQTHTTKFVNPELLGEVNNINKSLAELSAHVLALLATMPNGDVDKSWLKDAIDEFLHPEKHKARPHTLLALIDEFMATSQVRMQAQGRTISARTLAQYKVTKMWVASFLDARHMSDLAIERLDEAFYADFVTFLYRNNQRPNTVGKHIKNIKAVINSLPSHERMAIEFVEKGKCRIIREDVDNVYLNEDELRILNEHTYTDKRLSVVRDQFLMMAWTGCRYSDLGKLTKDNIITFDGGEYFRIAQRKTGAKVTIPILPPARAILERYGYVLPAPSTNQYFNRMVRLACREAGITGQVVITRQVAARSKFGVATLQDVAQRIEKCDCVTAHTARRSFATNMYKRGMPSLMIMAITGHKTEKAFLTYIKVSADENAQMMMERFLQAEKFP